MELIINGATVISHANKVIDYIQNIKNDNESRLINYLLTRKKQKFGGLFTDPEFPSEDDAKDYLYFQICNEERAIALEQYTIAAYFREFTKAKKLLDELISLKTRCYFGQITEVNKTVILDYNDLQVLNVYEELPLAATIWNEAQQKPVPENFDNNVIKI